MSSIVGHAIAGLTIYHSRTRHTARSVPWWWAGALVFFAVAPDIDYLIPALRPRGVAPPPDPLSLWVCSWSGATATVGEQTVRLSHSFFGSLLLPGIAFALLLCGVARHHARLMMAVQALVAGLSHVLLDLLVGVTPTALFWPWSATTIRLPFGILPSAGRVQVTNWFFYRNLLIELGVLLPIWCGVYWLRQRYRPTFWHRIVLLGLALTSGGAMLLAAQLQR